MTRTARFAGLVARTRATRVLVVAAAFLAVLVPSVPAWAHAQLIAADPAPNATLDSAPTAVTLTFNEHLDPEFTTIALSDATRRRIPAAEPVVAGPKGTIKPTAQLSNGTYTVAYRVVSTDGHTVQGAYDFTVSDPSRPAAPARSTVAASLDSGGGVPAGVLIGFGVVGAALAAAAVYLYTRRRRAP